MDGSDLRRAGRGKDEASGRVRGGRELVGEVRVRCDMETPLYCMPQIMGNRTDSDTVTHDFDSILGSSESSASELNT